METLELDQKVTWIGSRQCRHHAGVAEDQAGRRAGQLPLSLLNDRGAGLGRLAVRRHRRSDLEQVYRRQGAGDGAFHAASRRSTRTRPRCRPLSPRSGAPRNGSRRTRPRKCYDAIEPYVGSTSRDANVSRDHGAEEVDHRLRRRSSMRRATRAAKSLVPRADRHQADPDGEIIVTQTCSRPRRPIRPEGCWTGSAIAARIETRHLSKSFHLAGRDHPGR